MKKIIGVVVLMLGFVTIGNAQEKKSVNNWQKMMECANRVDYWLSRNETKMPHYLFLGTENHYSPKYNKCFIRLSYMHDGTGLDTFPMFIEFMHDAFEGTSLAGWSTSSNAANVAEGYCAIKNKPIPCRQAKQFINEHMEN